MPFIIERKIDLTILKVEKEKNIDYIKQKLKKLSKEIDVIDIINPNKKIRKEFRDFCYRPLKISYIMKTPKSLDIYLASLKRNRRKRILKSFRECEKQGISILKEKELTKESFDLFLKIYKNNLTEKERGIIILKKDWYHKRKDIACGVFAKRHNKIIGGILLAKRKNTVSFCFSSSEKKYFDIGINDYLNINAIMFVKELEYSYIIRGQDTNMYGHHLSPGLYLFKKSLGFQIQPRKKQGFALTKIVNFDNFGDTIFFVSCKNNDLEGNLFVKNKEVKTEAFNADFLEKLNIVYLT